MKIPLIRPNPPRLSEKMSDFLAIEKSEIFTNYGPVNSRFEVAAVEQLFGGVGGCTTVNNATIGLMIAIKECAPNVRERPYAIMPSFTFAATAHAAIWAGLTPILCDIDPQTWMPSAEAEEELIRRYEGRVGVMVPYATFGNGLPLERYEAIEDRYGIPTVVDAAASLGSYNDFGEGFGTGCRFSTVFSMHVTKTFATAEAGLIYSADATRVQRLRAMGNFGFVQPRTATMPGLNSKLSELGASLALTKLSGFDDIVADRSTLADAYRSELGNRWTFQTIRGTRTAYQFMPVLVPEDLAKHRDALIASLATEGIGCAKYFSPQLFDQPYFRQECLAGDLSVTNEVSRRVLSLPIWDGMRIEDVQEVCSVLKAAAGKL